MFFHLFLVKLLRKKCFLLCFPGWLYWETYVSDAKFVSGKPKCFWLYGKNIFCFRAAKFVFATHVSRAAKLGNICIRNNVFATMFPSLARRFILSGVKVIINMYFSKWKLKWIWASKPWNESWNCRKCLSDLLRTLSEQETLTSPDASQLNKLSCVKLFCQIQLIGAPINMDKTENIERHTQCVDNFHRFLSMVNRWV